LERQLQTKGKQQLTAAYQKDTRRQMKLRASFFRSKMNMARGESVAQPRGGGDEKHAAAPDLRGSPWKGKVSEGGAAGMRILSFL